MAGKYSVVGVVKFVQQSTPRHLCRAERAQEKRRKLIGSNLAIGKASLAMGLSSQADRRSLTGNVAALSLTRRMCSLIAFRSSLIISGSSGGSGVATALAHNSQIRSLRPTHKLPRIYRRMYGAGRSDVTLRSPWVGPRCPRSDQIESCWTVSSKFDRVHTTNPLETFYLLHWIVSFSVARENRRLRFMGSCSSLSATPA